MKDYNISKNKNKALFLSIFTLFILFIIPVSANNSIKDKELTVAFTHDLHSYLDTKEYKSNGETLEVGGFAKIKTIYDGIREENENTLILDAGDFSMGTLYQTVYTNKAIELRMLGFLGYDAVTLGNHEFDYGSDGLVKMLESAMESGDALPDIVMSNIDFENSTSENAKQLKKTMTDYGVQEYIIIKKEGIKVAVFGGMGEDADKSAPNSELVFTNIVDQAKITVSEIEEKENPDIIIYLSHAGTFDNPDSSEDEILAKEVPQIDLIVSGHTHSKLEEPIIVNNTYVVSSGEYGKNIGKIDLIQNKDGGWNIKDYSLIAVNEDIEADVETLEKIEEYRAYVNNFLNEYGFESYDQIIAYSPYNFTDLREMNDTHADQALGNLISDAIIQGIKDAEGDNYVAVDVSVVPTGIIRAAFKEGPITISDIYEVMSLGIGPDGTPGYPLADVYLTGKELKTVAEVDASIAPIMTTAQLYTSGLSYTFNPNRIILNRATDVKLISEDGNLIEIDDNKLYRVVADLYSAQMLGAVMDISKGILSIIPKDAEGIPIEDYNNAILYDKEGNEVKEWHVLASYMQSFEEASGVPTIPAIYENAQNRKELEDSKNIFRLIRQPNKTSIIIVLIVLLLVWVTIAFVRFVVRKVRTSRNKNKLERGS